ncbi:uncharacterized protein [Chelonus insularis]|uniref:uncharacterized protein n=1 Tax=Chelonus insularis TaxID=460826 RepID=UPI00158D50D2|nr:uncharacterized protein LOC118073851 [Chelonus insularis]XP_034950486.1 uncharacterized protein LOC118073851 [Chelonus insularis]XP_034950497.1 uncharacterized protein LOC118073851 [Chelonus insularis]
METKENPKEFRKNIEDTLICHDTNKNNNKVEQFYTCEEKWNILQELQTMSPELVCEKYNVELALLERWIENSVVIQEKLKRNKRSRSSSDSNSETDSSSSDSESGIPEKFIYPKSKQKILQDFEILHKKQFNRKYGINQHILHILIIQKLQVKDIRNKNSNEKSQTNQNQNLNNEFIDCNIENYLNSFINFQSSKKGYTHEELTQIKVNTEKAQKLVKHLYDWYLQMQQKGIFIAEFMLKQEANRIARTLNYDKFRANNTWLYLWYEIYNINLYTINKCAEYFDRSFLSQNSDFAKLSSKKHVQDNWKDRQEEIDNVGEDLFFWYDDITKDGKIISDEDLFVRAESVSILLNDRPFFPDIVWLYEWKKQYNIKCAETEWKLFKYSKSYFKRHRNVKAHKIYFKRKRLRLNRTYKNQLSLSASSSESNELDEIYLMKSWRPF